MNTTLLHHLEHELNFNCVDVDTAISLIASYRVARGYFYRSEEE